MTRTSRRTSAWLASTLALAAVAALPSGAQAAPFAARASAVPSYIFHNATSTFAFTIRNTGTSAGIGSVRILRPGGGWTIVGCPDAPPGWTTEATSSECRYRSAPAPADDLGPGQSSSRFAVAATTIPARTDRTGTWRVRVSRANDLSRAIAARREAPGLLVRVRTFQVLDAVIAAAPATPGDPCPAANTHAPAGSTRTIVICGRNRANTTLTPTAARSRLTGSLIADRGAFSSGPVPAGRTGSLVLGNWVGAAITGVPGTRHALEAVIGAASNRLSPVTDLGPFDVTPADPVADDKSVTASEDTPVPVELTGTDGNGDPLSFRVTHPPARGTLDTTTPATTCTSGAPRTCRATVAYTPLPDRSGPDGFTYVVNDGSADSAPATVSIDVGAVNDAPVNTLPSGRVAAVQGQPTTITGLSVADVDADPDAVRTTLSVAHGTLTVDESAIGGVPAVGGISGNGTSSVDLLGTVAQINATLGSGVVYRSSASHVGADELTVLTGDLGHNGAGGARSDTDALGIDVASGNDAPVAIGTSVRAREDTMVTITLESADADGDPQTFSVDQPAHGTLDLAPLPTCDGNVPNTCRKRVNYRPGPDFFGSDSFDFTTSDGTASSAPATVQIQVDSVNDPPDVEASAGSLAYTEGAGPVAVDPDVTVADRDSDLGGAIVSITGGHAAAEDRLAFTDQLGIMGSFDASSGTLTLAGTASPADYEAALRTVTYENSSANPSTATRTVRFQVSDADGASDSDTRDIAVTATEVSPTAVDDRATVDEDAAATAISVLANDTDPDGGPMVIAAVTQPANGIVVITGGGSGLTYEPPAEFCNAPPGTRPDTFTYTLNGGSTATVSVTVTCVDDPPQAGDDLFEGVQAAVGNTTLVVDQSDDGPPSVNGPHKVTTGDVLANDSDLDGPAPLRVRPATVTTDDGGSVTIEADGDFTFHPAPGTSCSNPTDAFDYDVRDAGASPATDTGTVTIRLSGCVWYVDNVATGNDGTSSAPFDTLAQAEAASGGGDTVYVFEGDGTSTGYDRGVDLKDDQRLLGEVSPLRVGGDTLFLGTAGARPDLANTGAAVVALASRNTVRGLRLDPEGSGAGIAGGAGDTGGTIDDVRIEDTGAGASRPALELQGTSGTWDVSDLIIDGTGVGAQTKGVVLQSAGTVNFKSDGAISVASRGRALDASRTDMGLDSVFDAIRVTASTDGGVSLVATGGKTTFGDGSGTDLSLRTTGPAGAFVLSSAAGVTVPADGTADIDAIGGPAVDVSGAPGASLAFDTVSSSSSPGHGITVSGLADGSFTATGGTLSGFNNQGFFLDGGSGAVAYAGRIGDGAGQSARIIARTGGTVILSGQIADGSDAGGGIELIGNSGGSTTLSGPAKVLNTSSGDALRMSASDGHTLLISGGGLDIDTTSGKGLEATRSGTLVVGGAGNTIDTGTGPAVGIVETDIGPGGVTLERVSANGAANGVLLDRTGLAGSLTVTGGSTGSCTAADKTGCSGGEIRNSTGGDDSSATPVGTGIVLKDTRSPSFTRMWLHDHSNYAIRGTDVAGFTLQDSVIGGTNGTNGTTPFDDSSVWFDRLTGSALIERSAISGGFEDNLRVRNTSGTLDRLALRSTTIGPNSAAGGNDGVSLGSSGGATMFATVEDSTFTSAAGDLLDFNHSGTGTGDLVLRRNAFSNNHGSIATGGGGLTLSNSGTSGSTSMTIEDNTFRDAVGPGILVVKTPGSSTQTGSFRRNIVGVSGTANSGSREGSALKLQNAGQGTTTWRVEDNRIYGYNNFGVEVLAGGGAVASPGAVNATIKRNAIKEPGTTPGTASIPKQGVHLNIGTVPGDTFQACADIRDNDLASSGADATPPLGFDFDVRLRQRQSTTIRLPGYIGGATDTVAVQSFVAGNNNTPPGTAVTASLNSPPGGGFVGGPGCPP